MNGLLTMSLRKLVLTVVTSVLTVMAVIIVVPLAQGGSTSAPQTDRVLGVSENQRVISRQASFEARLSDSAHSFESAQLSTIAQAATREELEYIDPEALSKQIEKQHKEQEALEKKKQTEAKQRAAAEEKRKVEEKRKAEETQKLAEAKKKQEAQAAPSALEGSGWKKVVASCYHDVGGLLATGETLHADDLIIAHKELPFGTKVELEYKGKKTIAYVGDRGPYINGRDIDLAPAVQAALGLYDGVKSVNMRILG